MPDPRAQGMTVKSVAGGLLVQSRDNAVVEDDATDHGDATRADRARTRRPALRLPGRQARQVEHHRVCHGPRHRRHRRRPDEPGRCGRIAALKAADAAKAAGLAVPLTKGSVVASDAFFPFADGLLVAIEAGATAVIQPGGSMRDDEVIKAADQHGIAMVFTGTRHFRH